MDDTCTALPLDLVDSLHQHLNSVDPNIQFTVEKEKDGQLAFLDILLSRDSEGSISTSVYWQPTHTDQYLNFQSHHPVAHKRSVVRTLMSRAESLSSSAVRNGDVTASAVAEHVFTAGHQVDLSKASVIDYHPHTQTRCLIESWHIQHQQAPLNRERGPMPGLYATLLD